MYLRRGLAGEEIQPGRTGRADRQAKDCLLHRYQLLRRQQPNSGLLDLGVCHDVAQAADQGRPIPVGQARSHS